MRNGRFIIVALVYTMICTGSLWIGNEMDARAAEENEECIAHVNKLIVSYKKAFKEMRAESKPLKTFIGNVTKSAKSWKFDKRQVNELIQQGVPKNQAQMLSRMLSKKLYITGKADDMKFKLERIETLITAPQVLNMQIRQKCR